VLFSIPWLAEVGKWNQTCGNGEWSDSIPPSHKNDPLPMWACRRADGKRVKGERKLAGTGCDDRSKTGREKENTGCSEQRIKQKGRGSRT